MHVSSNLKPKPRLGLLKLAVWVAALFGIVIPARSQGQSKVPLPAGPEKQTVETVCTACHTTERIASSTRTPEEWKTIVQRMIQNGATLLPNKIDAVAAYLAASFPPAPTGPVPRTPDGKPDLSGTWVSQSGGGGGRPIPLKLSNWGIDKYQWNREPSESKVLATGVGQTGSDKSYGEAVEESFRPRRDQDPWFNCYPAGLVRLGPPLRMNGAGPGVQVIQSPGEITIVYESRNAIRHIYTDGREHPKALELTWNGHSIGKWDGDTLVVDTIGLRDESWLDSIGHEHSTELHVVERIRRLDAATLEFERTINDPIAFEGVHTDKATLKLNPRYLWRQNMDDDCTQYMIRKPGFGEGLGGLLGIGEPPTATATSTR